MKTFDTFNYNKLEKLFLDLAHLDDLSIKFDFINDRYMVYYFYYDEWLFYYDKKPNDFYINYHIIWEVFEKLIDSSMKITLFMSSMIEKYFNIVDCSTYWSKNEIWS